ncbi:MAG: hypothetical protein ACI9O6_000923 [Glaciecola sp.]|jgi:hypothetical protein
MNRPPFVPIRPHKRENESVLGYLLRIAKVNHFLCADEFIKSYYPNSIKLAHSMNHQHSIAKFVAYVTGREVNHSEDEFIGRFSKSEQHYVEDKLSISEKPSICTECIKQDGYIKAEWQYVLNSYCKEHQRTHVNVCSHCQRELQWNVALLNLKCQRCGAKLNSKECPEPLHIIQQKNKSNLERKQYQEQLLKTAKTLVRPFDFMLTKIPVRPIMINNWCALIELAAQHIENKQDVANPYELRDSLDTACMYTDFTQSPLFHGATLREKEKLTTQFLRDLLDKNAIRRWFGLQECHIDLCLSLGLIKPVLKKNYVTPIYDYQDVKQIFAHLKILDDKGINISSAANEAPIFWCHPDNLITGILTRKISVRFEHPSQPSFENAWVDMNEARQYFDSCKTLLKKGVIGEDIAFEVFAGPKNKWDTLLQSELETYPTNSKKKMVVTKSLQQALTKYKSTKRDALQT